tara:strand:+ start:311 stop:730 length:420 start_codon:yes stop_codon:yes gene_type:complete
MKKLMFLYGEIVHGKLKQEINSIIERFDDLDRSPFDVSNDLIKKHIQNFSEQQPEGDSYYSRFFSKCLGYNITLNKPILEYVEVHSRERIRLSFEVDKFTDKDEEKISDKDLEKITNEFEKSFKNVLGLDYLEGRIFKQ